MKRPSCTRVKATRNPFCMEILYGSCGSDTLGEVCGGASSGADDNTSDWSSQNQYSKLERQCEIV